MDDIENQAWRDVPVTFGELYDILSTMQIGASSGVMYTTDRWRDSIKQTAQKKLEKNDD